MGLSGLVLHAVKPGGAFSVTCRRPATGWAPDGFTLSTGYQLDALCGVGGGSGSDTLVSLARVNISRPLRPAACPGGGGFWEFSYDYITGIDAPFSVTGWIPGGARVECTASTDTLGK